MNTIPTHRGACSAPSPPDLDRLWADTAVNNELSAITTMPAGTNINKPGSLFFVSLLKIASIVKGGYLPEHEALNSVKKSCCGLRWIPQEEIDYQWKRAYQRAKPRRRKEQSSLPTPIKQPIYQITEYDLITGKTKVLCEISPKTAVKAHELAALISNYVETGEVPKKRNLTITLISLWPEKAELKLSFTRYTKSLKYCVILAVSQFLKGGMSEDHVNGVFDVIIPLNFDVKNSPKNAQKSAFSPPVTHPPYMDKYAVM